MQTTLMNLDLLRLLLNPKCRPIMMETLAANIGTKVRGQMRLDAATLCPNSSLSADPNKVYMGRAGKLRTT